MTINVTSPEPNEIIRELKDLRADFAGIDTAKTRVLAIPVTDFRVFDAQKDALPDAAANDDLGLADAAGGVLLGAAANGGGTASQTNKAGIFIALPENYVDGSDITLRVRVKTSPVATATATIDAIVKALSDATLGSDICATAAQSCNSASYANFDFTITGTSLVAGSILNIVLVAAADDTGGTQDAVIAVCSVTLRYSGYGLDGASSS